MRKFAVFITAFAFFGFLAGGDSAAEPIGGKHNRAEIKKTCEDNGGSYWSNLDGYGCAKVCTKTGDACQVNCKNDGKCDGQTPPALTAGGGTRPAPTVGGVLGFGDRLPARPKGTMGVSPGGTATPR